MAGEFDQITNALKNAYPKNVIDPMVNEETPFRKKLKKSVPAGSKPSEGLVKFGANFNPPQNVGNLADGDTLPPAKDRTQDQAQLVPVIFSGSFQIGWTTRRAGNSNSSAFNGGELRRRTDETISNLSKFIESNYTGTHGTGRRARVESDGVNTFVAALPEAALLLRENFYISVRTTDGGAGVRDSTDLRLITGIDHSTRTVTYNGADQTLVAGDHVHVVTKLAQTITAANGLRGIVDDSTFLTTLHTLSRVTYPKWKSNVAGNGGTLRNLTEQILVRACHENRARSGKRVTDCWAGPGQLEKYIEFVAPDRRYTVPQGSSSPQSMVTGYTEGQLQHVFAGGQFNINLSYDIVPRELFLLNWDTFFHYVAQDMDWMDEGGMLQPTPGSGTYSASFLAYMGSIENIGCDMPLANTVVRDLKDPVIGDI